MKKGSRNRFKRTEKYPDSVGKNRPLVRMDGGPPAVSVFNIFISNLCKNKDSREKYWVEVLGVRFCSAFYSLIT